MLKYWSTHSEYLSFVADSVSFYNESESKRWHSFSDTFSKLSSLNLDPLANHLAPYYSNTGRPALHQPEIFRSFILMLDQQVLSLTSWVLKLASDDILATLIGCLPDSLPPLGSYYDFINRLWLRQSSLDVSDTKATHPYPRNSKPKTSPGKNKKFPNKHPDIVRRIAGFISDDRSFAFYFEKLLQEIFALVAIVPSADLGLISKESLTVSGDGTCVHCHSDSLGTKVCDCPSKGIYNCKCSRRYSDSDASFGWDSHLGSWFYGHTLYMLATYHPEHKIDLPLHLRFVSSKRHDSVTGLVALSEFRKINPDLPIKNLCFDSANDNYPTYKLCKSWDINPFIDMNANRGRPSTIPDKITIDDDGTPLCHAGFRMVNWGYSPARNDRKWRCPLKCGRVDTCSCQSSCSTSHYGRVVYTKPDWDVRLYTPVPRGTDEYKSIYKTRTSSERLNNRVLNDYHLHDLRIRGKKRFSFFTMMIGTNIHLDARIKINKNGAA